MQAKFEKICIYFNLGLLTALALLGTHFSKQQLIGSLYLHDAVLALGALSALIFIKNKIIRWPIVLILIISCGYLVYSLFHYDVEFGIIIRQFAIFGYLGCNYLLNQNNQSNYFLIIEKFLLGFSVLSVILQSIAVVSVITDGSFDLSDFNNHYWYSHMAMAGLIASSGAAVVYVKNWLSKILCWSFIFLLGWTTGHASAQLSILVIMVVYLILQLKGWLKFVPILFGILFTFTLIKTSPQFKDKNTDWRLLTWSYLLNDLIENKYGLIGNGFGAPYTNTELEMYLFEEISSTALQERGRPDERYISPPHNSFITIFFAIGIVPGLLIFTPFLYVFSYLKGKFESDKKFSYMVLLCLVGLTIWCSFNVVLELPHSSGFFWLIYFTFWKLHSTTSQSHYA